MCISPRSDVSDGYRCRCPACHKCISIRDESFFIKSCITVQKWLVLMYPVTAAAEEAEVTEATACVVYWWLREVQVVADHNDSTWGPRKNCPD